MPLGWVGQLDCSPRNEGNSSPRIYSPRSIFLLWAIHSNISYYPQVSADWRTTANDVGSKGFYVAVGRLWAKQRTPFNNNTTEWVPLYLVVSDFEIEKTIAMEGGGMGASDVGFRFKDEWIEVPIDADVPSYSAPPEPDQPNVFILRAGNKLEVTDLVVRTQEQLNNIPYEIREKQSFSEIQDFLKSRLKKQ